MRSLRLPMAVSKKEEKNKWQFQLVIIPRKGILEKFDEIPDTLEIDDKERTEHYHLTKEGLMEADDEFKDALTQDWWSSTDLPTTTINPRRCCK